VQGGTTISGVALRSAKPRVVYWTNIPTPYVQDRFNALARRGNLNFEAWFMSKRESNRSWEVIESDWGFKFRYLRGIGSIDARFSIPTDLITRPPDVLVSIYAQAAFVVGRKITQFRGARHAFYVEKTFDNWVRRRPWKERLKRHLFTQADGFLVAGPDARSYAVSYGARDSRIFEVANSTDIGFYAAGSRLGDEQRNALRERLGIHGVTFLYVGRLWWGKGLTHLLDAYADARRRLSGPSTLLLVGDGSDEQALRDYCAQKAILDVVFAGFHQRPQLAAIYGASDVFVFPTLGDTYGQVVDEAMACGLPVISTSTAGEITERVLQGVTGFIVSPRDSEAFSDRMVELGSSRLREQMGRASRLQIAPRTPQRWAHQFESAVDRILAMPRAN
jgi:glycosyltransferase involved in cell wall biosynthesis